MKDKQH